MKQKIMGIMATTGITLVVLAGIASLYGAKFLFVSSVFESLGANIVIHMGFLLTQRFESRYIVFDSLLDIGYTIIVLIIFGAVFNWYGSTPIWILVIMAIVIYIIGCFINIFRVREEMKKINELLEKRSSLQG